MAAKRRWYVHAAEGYRAGALALTGFEEDE
jgi:hypothetical protein